MTTEHKYAHVLRWIAEGKKVQCRSHKNNPWANWPKDFSQQQVYMVLSGNGEYMFQLAPRTVMIGDVECEAPVNGATDAFIYYTAADGTVYRAHPDNAAAEILNRRAFASEQAAVAAYNAVTKLMNQQTD